MSYCFKLICFVYVFISFSNSRRLKSDNTTSNTDMLNLVLDQVIYNNKNVSKMVSLDSEMFAIADDSSEITIWKNLNETYKKIKLHTDEITALSFYSGKLYSGGKDNQIIIWDKDDESNYSKYIIDEAPLIIVEPNNGLISYASKTNISIIGFSPSLQNLEFSEDIKKIHRLKNGNIISIGSDLKIWDLNNFSQPLSIISLNSKNVTTLIELSNRVLVIAFDDKTLSSWDGNNGYKMIKSIKYEKGIIKSSIEIETGKIIFFSNDYYSEEWDTYSDSTTMNLKFYFLGYNPAMINLKNNKLAIGQKNGFIKIINTDKELLSDILIFGHKKQINGLIELENGFILSASDDNTVKLWDPSTSQYPLTNLDHDAPVKEIALVGKKFLVSLSKYLYIWDMTKNYRLIQKVDLKTEQANSIIDLNNENFAVVIENKVIKWDIKKISTVHEEEISDFISLLDGKMASVSLNGDLNIYEFNFTTNSLVKINNRQFGVGITKILELSEENQLAVAFVDKTISILNLNLDTISQLSRHTSQITSLVRIGHFQFASAGHDKEILIWETKNLNLVQKVTTKNNISGLVQITTQRYATYSDDNFEIPIWNILHTYEPSSETQKYIFLICSITLLVCILIVVLFALKHFNIFTCFKNKKAIDNHDLRSDINISSRY